MWAYAATLLLVAGVASSENSYDSPGCSRMPESSHFVSGEPAGKNVGTLACERIPMCSAAKTGDVQTLR